MTPLAGFLCGWQDLLRAFHGVSYCGPLVCLANLAPRSASPTLLACPSSPPAPSKTAEQKLCKIDVAAVQSPSSVILCNNWLNNFCFYIYGSVLINEGWITLHSHICSQVVGTCMKLESIKMFILQTSLVSLKFQGVTDTVWTAFQRMFQVFFLIQS